MKLLLLAIGLALSQTTTAATIACEGAGTVNNAGLVESTSLKVELDTAKQVLRYQGPHASLVLPANQTLALKVTVASNAERGTSYYVANASTAGHGGETNLFFLQALSGDAAAAVSETPHARRFLYRGSYGYRIEATLQCRYR